jgi:uncharacterized protein YegP (UPF0339 family)
MAGRFVIESAGQHHFVLKAASGEIIATTERYTTKASAQNGIESVKATLPTAPTDGETGGLSKTSRRRVRLGSSGWSAQLRCPGRVSGPVRLRSTDAPRESAWICVNEQLDVRWTGQG